MTKTSLITGVNGHLGNNLLRNLLQKGENVKGTVRDLSNLKGFEGLNFKPIQADLMDKNTLMRALQGVDTLYQVAAVFKLWSKNPQKDIYEANMRATQNIMEAAAAMKVSKIVYVSSIAALGRNQTPFTADSYNTETENIYYKSKIDSEKLAWQLAQKFDLDMVSVCPSAMIGSHCTALTPSHNMLRLALNGEIFADSQFYINWVDVKDVAEGCYLAAHKGQKGRRYILGTHKAIGITEMLSIAQELFPELQLKTPFKMPKWMLQLSAASMEFMSKINGKAPMLQKNQVRMYFKVQQDLDLSLSEKDLGYKPIHPRIALQNALTYLKQNETIV